MDELGRTVSEMITYGKGDAAFTVALNYRYDADGGLVGMVYPDGSEVSFSRERGELKQSQLPNGETIDWRDYHWLRPTSIRSPSAEQIITYDALLRPVQMQVKTDDELLLTRSYRYDEANRIEAINNGGSESRYSYDRADRLTQALPPQELQDQGLPVESYAYDSMGNRVGSLHQPGKWHYGDGNRLLQRGEGDALVRFDYTSSGNIAAEISATNIRRLEYDATDRLVRVETNGVETALYSYDPLGRRISKIVNGKTTWYIYSLEGLIAELDAQGAMQVAYGWEPGTVFGTAPLWQANIAPGQTLAQAKYHFLFRDHLGTPIIAVDNQGDSTWEGKSETFGKTILNHNNQIVMNLRFPGQYYDSETGGHYNYFRDYEPVTGRYKQRDPIGLKGGVNIYKYSFDPLKNTDPLGLNPMAGAVAGGIISGPPGAIIGGVVGLSLGIYLSLQCDDNEEDKKCPPCEPPVGTNCYAKDTGHTHNGWDPHYHIYSRGQIQKTCECRWDRLSGKAGAFEFPPDNMNDCMSYLNPPANLL